MTLTEEMITIPSISGDYSIFVDHYWMAHRESPDDIAFIGQYDTSPQCNVNEFVARKVMERYRDPNLVLIKRPLVVLLHLCGTD